MERWRENMADFNKKSFKYLYQNRLDGPIARHVLVQISRFSNIFLHEIRNFFSQQLYQ